MMPDFFRPSWIWKGESVMKLSLSIGCLMLVAILAVACAPGAESAPPTAVIVTVIATQEPAITPLVTPDGELSPVDLSGPEMKLGATWLYVDLSTIIAVPAGPFLMGRGGGTDNPEHEVMLSDYWIYQSEVTNAQYAFCVAQGSCSPPNEEENTGYIDPLRAGDPVTGVNWDQARSYCQFVRGRLPTEAEWEKAAAWDDVHKLKYIYPWGDAAPTCNLANFNNCIGKTTNVAQYPQGASPYDLLGGAGNAYEWVSDYYDPLYYRTSPTEDPPGPASGDRRSIRSGGYRSNKDQMPSAVRFFDNPASQTRDLGFRCVVEDPTWYAPYCELVQQYGSPGPSGGIDGFDIPTETCPIVDIVPGEYCQDGVGQTTLTFSPAGGTEVVPAGCSGGPTVYTCLVDGGTAFGTWNCSVPPPPLEPGCPVNYTQMGDECIPDSGTDGECLPGFNYDPVLQCCSATAGSDSAIIPLCPAGTYFSNSDNACVPWPVANLVHASQDVHVDTCPGPGDDPCDPAVEECDPGGCTQPAGVSCPFGWNSSQCCCSGPNGGCYSP
jgi:formylglycine-generating enzyme required for sulfatase activity